MKRTHIITIIFFIILSIGAYVFLPNFKTDKSTASDTKPEKPVDSKDGFSIEEYLTKVSQNLNKDTLALVNGFIKAENWSALASIYHTKGESVAEAHYTLLGAKNKADYERSGDLFQATASISNTPAMSSFLIEKAVFAFEKAFNMDTTDIKVKMKLATSFIEQGTAPMQGISMLLDIVKRDPANADAHLLLGKFAMMSNQFEKAVQRLEKVLSLRPQSNDARFLLAVAHQNLGNKDKAIEFLEQCKTNETNPELKQEIEGYIKQLKEN
jgi:tetratricopeptide (TPR) repeat protein